MKEQLGRIRNVLLQGCALDEKTLDITAFLDDLVSVIQTRWEQRVRASSVPTPARIVCVVLGLLWLAAATASAQINTGTVSGTILDPKAAPVPGVLVELVDQQTSVVRTATANLRGFYIFPLVPAGIYSLSAKAQGFKAFRQSDIQLEVNQNLTVLIALELGLVTETVTISSTPPPVDTVSSSVKDVVDQKRISELPLNGRNIIQLQQLVPGAVFAGSGDQLAGTPIFQVNGGIGGSNNYSLDAGEHIDTFYNSPMRFPNPDALQEFSIQTSSYTAEYGRNRGATVNAVTRSGTNEFHGSLFHFLRNDKLDARDFFATGRPPFKRNQFGTTFGGPVRKNQTFFFFSWESTRERGSPSAARFRTVSQAMRQGDFSELTKAIVDPTNGQPFPNKFIPAARWSAPARKFLDQFVPLPNQPNGFFAADRANRGNVDQFLGRFDHQFSSKDLFYVRYLYGNDDIAVNQGDFPNWFSFVNFKRNSAVANYTRTFSPALLNSATFTFNRVVHLYNVDPEFHWQSLGANIPDTVAGQKGWLILGLPGYFTAQNGLPWDVRRNTYRIANTTTWIKSNHAIKFGAQISRYATSQLFEFYSAGALSFSGQFTTDPAADFLIGRIASMRQDSPAGNELRQTLWGFFFADDYKIHPHLTLNLGLRYEPYFGFRETER